LLDIFKARRRARVHVVNGHVARSAQALGHPRRNRRFATILRPLLASSSGPCSDALYLLTPHPAARPSFAPLSLIVKLGPLSRRLVRSHPLLQRLRRNGQEHARGGCRDCLRLLLLDPVFPPDFRTWKPARRRAVVSGHGTCRCWRCGSYANATWRGRTGRCSARECGGDQAAKRRRRIIRDYGNRSCSVLAARLGRRPPGTVTTLWASAAERRDRAPRA